MNFSRNLCNSRNEQRSAQFNICSLGSFVDDGTPLLPGNMHAILWIQKGTGNVLIDTTEHEVEDDTIFYIKPGQPMRAVIHEPAKGFLISFGNQFLGLFEKNSTLNSSNSLHSHCLPCQVIHLQSETRLFLENIAGKMHQEFSCYNDMQTEIISSFLKIFIIYLIRQCDVVDHGPDYCRKNELASSFFSLLEKHFVDKKQVRDYADILFVTPGYMNKVVKETTGSTASYHIQQRIVLEAKRRIISGGTNLKEIAYTLGFCDPAHFSKFFKIGAGTNFTSFKRTATGYSQFV